MEMWDVYNEKRQLLGKTIQRGSLLPEGEFHLVVFAILKNKNQQYLIGQRAAEKSYPFSWEFCGGSALAGEDSHSAIVREVKEEVGLSLTQKGKLLTTYYSYSTCSAICDIWLFETDFTEKDIVLQKTEVAAFRLVSLAAFQTLLQNNNFMAGNRKIAESITNGSLLIE